MRQGSQTANTPQTPMAPPAMATPQTYALAGWGRSRTRVQNRLTTPAPTAAANTSTPRTAEPGVAELKNGIQRIPRTNEPRAIKPCQVSGMYSQNIHPAGAAGHDRSGCQADVGRQVGVGTAQPGGALNFHRSGWSGGGSSRPGCQSGCQS